MKRYDTRVLPFVLLLTFAALSISAQTSRKSVTASEVTGTFRMDFRGKFRGNWNEIKIASAGRGKVHVGMQLTFPYEMDNGELMANVGELDEIFSIKGDLATSTSAACTITIKFVRPGTIKVDQQGSDVDCGFGNRVYASGTYRKVSSKKPNFNVAQ